MASIGVIGGGLSGMAAAAALAGNGFQVDLYESKPYLGGRATSYHVPSLTGVAESIDNCQHILLRCCHNLLDFYRRLGVSDAIEWHREINFVEPGGRTSVFGRGRLPAPLHFTESFLSLRFLDAREKVALARAILALRREAGERRGLDSITMAEWLAEQRQPPRVVERFWRQVLVSAINEELDAMAASHGFQVFRLAFLGSASAYEMGIPAVPLAELYSTARWRRFPNVRLHLRTPVERVEEGEILTRECARKHDVCVVALPADRLAAVLSGWNPPALEHSPITGIHLWFDRPVTDLPHATLLDRTIQWMFNKGAGMAIQLVISASRSLASCGKRDIVDLAVRELAEFFPAVRQAQLIRSHVVKEMHATFSAKPGICRPAPGAIRPRTVVAGDWTASGWPATMEGSARSGYRAAEAVAALVNSPARFVIEDAWIPADDGIKDRSSLSRGDDR